jgi:hypothetical protein
MIPRNPAVNNARRQAMGSFTFPPERVASLVADDMIEPSNELEGTFQSGFNMTASTVIPAVTVDSFGSGLRQFDGCRHRPTAGRRRTT